MPTMNHLLDKNSLHNRYFVMRHGESEANVAGIVVSDPAIGVDSYSLTKLGEQQVLDSLNKQSALPKKQTVIYSSDFARTRRSAEIAAQFLEVSVIHYSKLLRERNFGNWERGDNKSYDRVYTNDAESSAHTKDNVESVDQVIDHATALVEELESKYTKKTILLVTHQDTIRILQSVFSGRDPRSHFRLPTVKNGGIRELVLTSSEDS